VTEQASWLLAVRRALRAATGAPPGRAHPRAARANRDHERMRDTAAKLRTDPGHAAPGPSIDADRPHHD
jgi:hypothetical protein